MTEEIQKTYHAVEQNGVVTAIWEMMGRKHIRTIDPRSQEGKMLLSHYESESTVTSQVATQES